MVRRDGATVEFQAPTEAWVDISSHSLPCQDRYSCGNRDVEDLIELDSWDEKSVVQNCRSRFFCGKPYTFAGNLMIAINPCRHLRSLHDSDLKSDYLRFNRTDLPAHVYGVSAAAYWGLCAGRGNQTISLSGESGSGKTLTAALLTGHIMGAPGLMSNVDSRGGLRDSIMKRDKMTSQEGEGFEGLMECRRTILESLGNAGTPLHRNSTRFVEHTRVKFSGDASRVLGVETKTLLLETSRVSYLLGRGRTFHIFYQVLLADETFKRRFLLDGKSASDFRLTTDRGFSRTSGEFSSARASDSSSRDGESSSFRRRGRSYPLGKTALDKTIAALTSMGVTGEETEHLFAGLSAVMYLGQVEFRKVATGEVLRDFGVVEIADESPLEAASRMLGCHKHDLQDALLTRSLTAGVQEMLTVPLTKAQARNTRDMFAREVYLRLFRWLIKRLNDTSRFTSSYEGREREGMDALSIGLLDMCGFEDLDTNSFEQLCRNYVAEKLHGMFLRDEICSRTQEAAIQVEENVQLLNMLEGPLGLVWLADEECLCPEGSDQSFVNKLVRDETTQQSISVPDDSRRGEEEASMAWPICAVNTSSDGRSEPRFCIQHFAGPVTYTAANIVEKNRSGAGKTLLDLLDDACTNRLVGAQSRSEIYREERRACAADGTPDHRRRNLYRRKLDETILSQYRSHLAVLLQEIGATEVQYVLCVKPNEELSPDYLNDKGLLRQLQMAGVVALLRSTSLSLPEGGRVDKEAFFRNFRAIPEVLQRILSNEDSCCKLGHRKIFFRSGVLETLEQRREMFEQRTCVLIQRTWRQHQHARHLHVDADSIHFSDATHEAQREQEAPYHVAEHRYQKDLSTNSKAREMTEQDKAARTTTVATEGSLLPMMACSAWSVTRPIKPHTSTNPPLSTSREASKHSGTGGTRRRQASIREARLGSCVILRLSHLNESDRLNFMTRPVPDKYGAIRCRVTRQEDTGWKTRLTPTYSMHLIEDRTNTFMMLARRKPLSRTANFYIRANQALKTSKDSPYFIGKLRAKDGSRRSYTLYDDGISPQQSSKDRRRGPLMRKVLVEVVFSPTSDSAYGSRAMEALVSVDDCPPADGSVALVRRRLDGGKMIHSFHEQNKHHKLVRMKNRKPRYDPKEGAYMLDLPDRTSKLSIKNVQLVLLDSAGNTLSRRAQKEAPMNSSGFSFAARPHNDGDTHLRRAWEDEEANLIAKYDEEFVPFSFGKSAVNEFVVDFGWPLTPLQVFGLALSTIDTSI